MAAQTVLFVSNRVEGYHNIQAWLEELQKDFPGSTIEPFWCVGVPQTTPDTVVQTVVFYATVKVITPARGYEQ